MPAAFAISSCVLSDASRRARSGSLRSLRRPRPRIRAVVTSSSGTSSSDVWVGPLILAALLIQGLLCALTIRSREIVDGLEKRKATSPRVALDARLLAVRDLLG